MHKDNQTVVRERIFVDKANPDTLRDEITTVDHALTRPWTVMRSYQREGPALARERLLRSQPLSHSRPRDLLHGQRPGLDADAQEPAAARSEILYSIKDDAEDALSRRPPYRTSCGWVG